MRYLLSVAALLFAVSTSAGENTFVSQTLGFQMTKPPSWTYLSANTYLDQMKQVKTLDKEYQEHFNQALRAPLVVITKHPASYPGVNTSFKADVKPYGVIQKGASGADALNALITQLRRLVKDLKVSKGPVKTVVGGQNAGYVKMNYATVSTTGIEVALTTEMWAVPRENYIYLLGASYKLGSEDSSMEIESIVQSISIR